MRLRGQDYAFAPRNIAPVVGALLADPTMPAASAGRLALLLVQHLEEHGMRIARRLVSDERVPELARRELRRRLQAA